MSEFKLQQEGYTSTTSIPNCFIEQYMPKAAGEFVKTYIYLLKCVEENRSALSISRIADAMENSEKDTIRALKYWEKRGLLKLTFEDNTLVSLRLTSISEAGQRAQGANPDPYKEDPVSSLKNEEIAVSTAGSKEVSSSTPEPAKQKKQYSRSEIDKFSKQDDIAQLLFIIEKYTGRTLSGTDLNTVLFLYDTLQFPADLIEYLVEYCVSKGHKSMRYIEKTAIGWSEQGISNVKAAKLLNRIHSDNCYPVLKAFGLSGRRPVKSEEDYVAKWSQSYGFSLEVILEAVNRTMSTIHQPSFEYADGILKRWKSLSVSTLEDIKALDEKREKQLSKAQSLANSRNVSGADKEPVATGNTPNKFHNFAQRTYDFDELEKKLFKV